MPDQKQLLYPSARAWRDATSKRLTLFGMSGLGKTHISNILRADVGWFHYSADYRIGTRYMGEHITDSFKAAAMKVPELAELFMSDSIYIASNITFDNLAPLSNYLGKPGDAQRGGLEFDEYMRRQELHRQAEINTMLDTPHFIDRAKRLYGYENFVCDSSGSLCEVVDPSDPLDPVLQCLSQTTLLVWIEGNEAHTEALIRRFDRAPKPMYYQPEFLRAAWYDYLETQEVAASDVDPDSFVRWAYARALAHRQPRYRDMAQQWGISVRAADISCVTNGEDLVELVASAFP